MDISLPNISSLSTDIGVTSLAAKSKAQKALLPESKSTNSHDAVKASLFEALSSTLESLLRNHSERLRVQNELFEQHMRDLYS